MTGPDHFTQATCWIQRAGRELDNGAIDEARVAAEIAAAHATAALAAATVVARLRGRVDDARSWARVLTDRKES